jgi:hypothetical protein
VSVGSHHHVEHSVANHPAVRLCTHAT